MDVGPESAARASQPTIPKRHSTSPHAAARISLMISLPVGFSPYRARGRTYAKKNDTETQIFFEGKEMTFRSQVLWFGATKRDSRQFGFVRQRRGVYQAASIARYR